jgi:hypothetical protein
VSDGRDSKAAGTASWGNLADPRWHADQLANRITTNSYKAGALAARLLPGAVAAGLATPAGLGANFASPQRRAMIERHLQRVDPTLRGLRLRRAVQESFDS